MKTFVNEMSYSLLCSATCCGLELPITVQLRHTSLPSPLSMLMGYKHLTYQPDCRQVNKLNSNLGHEKKSLYTGL